MGSYIRIYHKHGLVFTASLKHDGYQIERDNMGIKTVFKFVSRDKLLDKLAELRLDPDYTDEEWSPPPPAHHPDEFSNLDNLMPKPIPTNSRRIPRRLQYAMIGNRRYPFPAPSHDDVVSTPLDDDPPSFARFFDYHYNNTAQVLARILKRREDAESDTAE